MPLKPGTVYIYDLNIPNSPKGTDTFFVTRQTIDLLGVTCVVVRDTGTIGGQVEEDTFDYFEYRQEFALGTAEDMAKVVALDQKVKVPFGSFSNVLKTLEFSGLEPDARENKYYVPSIGNVLTVDLVTGERDELIRIEHR